MLTLAKMCQENSDYTDCVIQCGDFSSDDSEEDHERNRYLISDVIQSIYNPANYSNIRILLQSVI